ncbi:hypothetical protein LJC27_01975, partial [Christensenellaceae bacterium OttesenSCG-928-M15]|nr:hypothetical protein [Christensenellaceae bacterium OttesenSCG-928-M15]
NTGASFLFKNERKEEITYGAGYKIERQRKGRWRKIDGYSDFVAMMYSLKPGEEKVLEFNWRRYYGELPAGTYRLVKECNNMDNDGPFSIAAIFSIE